MQIIVDGNGDYTVQLLACVRYAGETSDFADSELRSEVGAQQFWGIAASIATVLGVVVVICAAALAVGQLREAAKARHLAAMLQIYDLIGSSQARAARRFIYRELTSEPHTVTDSEREAIDDVAVLLDRVGLLVKAGLVPTEVLFEGHAEMIVRIWVKLRPYIYSYRKQIGGRHVNDFEYLATLAEAYMAKKGLAMPLGYSS